MYLIIDKKTQAILHMSNSVPDQARKPEELLPSYDPKTMDFGRAPGAFIPVRFAIRKGVVVDLDPPAETPEESVDDARTRILRGFEQSALAVRSQLIPDHQMLNAGVGLYDDGRVQTIRDTVQAFRDEYYRLEAAAKRAKTVKGLEAIKPNFPTALVVPKTKAAAKTKSK